MSQMKRHWTRLTIMQQRKILEVVEEKDGEGERKEKEDAKDAGIFPRSRRQGSTS